MLASPLFGKDGAFHQVLEGFLNATIRKIIYTTNTVEGYHRQVRKVTKTKGVFQTDDALYKLVYPAYRNIRKKWTMPLANWGQTAQQLAIKFGDRFKIMKLCAVAGSSSSKRDF